MGHRWTTLLALLMGLNTFWAVAGQLPSPLTQADWRPSPCLPQPTTAGLLFGPAGDSRQAAFLISRPGVLPDEKDWTVDLDFTASLVGMYGTGFALRDVASGKDYLRVHVDQGLGAIQLYAGDDARSMIAPGSSWDGSPILMPKEARPLLHHYRLEKRGERIAMLLDGKRLIALGGGNRRWCLRLGNDGVVQPGPWSSFVVSRLEILGAQGQTLVRFGDGQVEESSRESVVKASFDGAVSGVEADESAPAILSETGHLRIVAKDGVARVSPGTVIEFRPRVDAPDFVPSEVGLVVDGLLVATKRPTLRDRLLPVLSFAVPETIGVKSRVRIVAANEQKRQVILSRVDVEVVAKPPSVAYAIKGETAELTHAEGLGTVWPYAQGDALGKCADLGKLRIDERRLPVGRYQLALIPQASDGAILEPVYGAIDVRPRYSLSSDADHATLALEGKVDGTTLRVVANEGASSIATRVYVRGALVTSRKGGSFECPVPLGDVPSGPVEIRVVGEAADHTLYPAETLTLSVRNPLWDSLRARDARAKRLDALLVRLGQDDANVAYWYERAKSEPKFRVYASSTLVMSSDQFGRIASVALLDTVVVPGKAGECIAACKAAIAKRASTRLEIGLLEKAMGLKEQARASLERSADEAGESSGTETAARQALRDL